MSLNTQNLIHKIKTNKSTLSHSEFAYEKLDLDGFYRGVFLNLEVIFWKTENGWYINVPKLFAYIGSSKKINDWKRSASSIEYIEEIVEAGNPAVTPFINRKGGGTNEHISSLSGEYAHEEIICEIIGWASIKHKILMNRMIINMHTLDLKNKHDLSLKEKDERYEDLMQKFDRMHLENQNIIKRLEEDRCKSESRYEEEKRISQARHTELITEIRDLRTTLSDLRAMIVRMIPNHETLPRNNTDKLQIWMHACTYNDAERFVIEFTRTQRRTLNSKIKSIKNAHDDYEELYRVSSACAVTYVNKIKENLGIRRNQVPHKVTSFYIDQEGVDTIIRFFAQIEANNRNPPPINE